MVMKPILVLCLLALVISQSCVSNVKEMTVYPQMRENYLWEMNKLFSGSNLKYSFEETPTYFSLIPPFYEANDPVEHGEPGTTMVSLKALRQPLNGAWLNHFAFLENDEIEKTWDVHYAEGAALENHLPPSFANRVNVIINEPMMKCFDLEFITSDVIVVDCAEQQVPAGEDKVPMINYFYVIRKTDTPDSAKKNRIQTTNYKGYEQITGRMMQYHTYYKNNIGQSMGEETPQKILLRGQQAFNSETGTPTALDANCIIEAFKLDDTFQITDTTHHLDKGVIAKDLGLTPDQQATFEFKLIDFKIMPNGDIYVLDAFNGIFVYKINDTSNWVYVKQIQTYSERAFGFDVSLRFNADGTVNTHLAVIYQKNVVIYQNGVQITGYQLSAETTYPADVYLSQNYVITYTQKVITLYSSETNLQISTIKPLYKTFAINPYEPDLVTVTNTQSHRIVLSHGYLQVHSTVDSGYSNFVVKAIDDLKEECKITVNYQIVKADDTVIKSLNTDPFPGIMTYPADPFKLDQIAAGPNLHYANLEGASEHVDVKVYSIWDLAVKGTVWPQAADIIYSDIIVDPNETNASKFFFLYQQKNKMVTIWDCLAVNQLTNEVDCEQQDQFAVPTELNKQKTQFDWHVTYKEQLTMEFMESDYEIGIYVSHEGQAEKILSITYPSDDQKNKITSFTILQDVIYVVLNGQKIIDCYTGFFPTLTKFTITEAMVKEQGYNGIWNPKKVFGNQQIKSQLLFIQSDEDVLLGDYKQTFTLIKSMPIQRNSDVALAIGINTFFIVQKSTASEIIQEYNFKNLNRIYLTKSLPLYGKYTIQTPLTMDFSSSTGFMFIRALDVANKKTVLLVYEPNVPGHQSLLKVIETNALIDEGQTLDMSVAGSSQMFIYLNNKTQQRLISLFQDAIMTVAPSSLSSQYVTNLKAGVAVSGFSTSPTLNVSYDVKFLNTQSICTIDQNILNKSNSLFTFVDKPESQYIKLSNNWYTGSLITFDIECESCQSHLIELENPIAHITDGTAFGLLKLLDGIPYIDGMAAYQADQELVFQDKNDQLAYKHKMELPNYTYCDIISSSDDFQYIFSGCLQQDQATLYVSSCNATKCTPIQPNTRILTDVQGIGKVMLKDGILIVLNTRVSFPTSQNGNIHIFNFGINAQSQQWELTNRQVINQEYLNAQFNVAMADFDLIKFQIGNAQYYKLFISDTKSGLFFLDYYLDGGKPKYILHEQLNLNEYLNKDQVVKSDTYFYQVKVINQSIANNKLTVTVLVTTSNIAHYAITLQFDISEPTKGQKLIKNTYSVPFLLNQYGTWTTINKLRVHNGYAVIPFTNRTYIMMAVYKLPTTYTQDKTQMVALIGGLRELYPYATTDIVTLLKDDPAFTTPVLYTNVVYSRNADNHMLIKYKLNEGPVLHVQNGHQVPSQKITITGSNDYSTPVGTIQVTQNKNPDDPDKPDNKKEKSSNWWWITLIVVFGVAIIGAIGFFGYKKYANTHVQPLLD